MPSQKNVFKCISKSETETHTSYQLQDEQRKDTVTARIDNSSGQPPIVPGKTYSVTFTELKE